MEEIPVRSGYTMTGPHMDAMAGTSRTDEHRRTATGGAFDAFVAPHVHVLLRVAVSVTQNTADAEDLVQDTLLRAFRGMGTFDGPSPRAWLLTIMRNANINNHRRRRPTLLRGTSDQIREAERRCTPAPSAEDVATGPAPPPWIADALERLTPRLRQVVQLVDIDGLTYDETAAVLAIPAGTVMSRLHRARHRMRTYLTNQPDFRNGHP